MKKTDAAPIRVGKISVITVCKNAASLLAETIDSVLQQTAIKSGRMELEYIIRDGASTDETQAVVESFASSDIRFQSAADGGMYDALSEGLLESTGDMVCYLNAGDYFHKCAFDVVADVSESYPVRWVTGMNVKYNSQSQITSVQIPFRFKRSLIRSGSYGRALPFIQQESTFWQRSLHGSIDFNFLRRLKFAGDAYLWHQFSMENELAVIQSHLGGFRVHPGQLSETLNRYQKERELFEESAKPSTKLFELAEKSLWQLPASAKRRLNPDYCFYFDGKRERWRNYRSGSPPCSTTAVET